MDKKKQCPVDPGKVLIGLECCRIQDLRICFKCPYRNKNCDVLLMEDALTYICYLEEQLNAKANTAD